MATEPTPFYNKLNDFVGANEAYMWLMWFDELTPAEQALIGIWELQQEVINGGFFQYMHNSSGEHEPAMREILKEIGAQRAFAILERAVELIGADVRQGDYFTKLNALPDKSRDEFCALDIEFYHQLENLAYLLFRYLSKHRDQLDAPDEFWKEVAIQ